MTSASRPEAVPFAAGSGELPPALGPVLTDPDTRLLLIVAPDTGDAEVHAAIGLAEARAAEGHDTVLADAGFGGPRLHEILGVPNLEGLADIFEFGASPGRVMTRPTGRRFDFIPAGAYAPEPGAILGSTRWGRIVAELPEDTVMMVFVPAETPGLEALSRRAGRAIVVGEPAGVDRAAASLDPACEITAVVEPAGPVAPERGPEAGAERRPAIFDAPQLTEPVVFRSDRRRRRIAPYLWVVLAAVVVAGGWFMYRAYQATPEPVPPTSPTEAAAEPEPEPVPEPVETPIGFSVAVEAHQDPAQARERLAWMRQADPGVSFYMAPVPINGSVWYRLLAGPVTDRESGMTLMRRLVDADVKTAFDDWAVRPTTFAFHLGELPTAAAAEARASELAERGIPAYVVPIRYEPGEPRYRVYGGAFETRGAASVMQEMLDEVGIDAPLVERVGEPVRGVE